MTDDKPKMKPFGDIVVKTGEYEKDGKTRNRYKNIGTLFASENAAEALRGHRVTIKLDALPQGGDGWLSVFERENKEQSGYEKAKEARAKLDDNFSLNDIPDFD